MIRIGLAAALAAAACGSASAQVRTVPQAPLVSAFGACAARQRPAEARALMATAIGSREERRVARRLAESRTGCVPRRGLNYLLMLTGEFRGSVAEALLETDPAAIARLRALPSRLAVRPGEADGRMFVNSYARCIADAEPARSARLLDLPAEATPDQRNAAFLEYGDLLNDCMPLGLRYRINAVDVRNHIAMRLYEIAFPAATPADQSMPRQP